MREALLIISHHRRHLSGLCCINSSSISSALQAYKDEELGYKTIYTIIHTHFDGFGVILVSLFVLDPGKVNKSG